MTDANPPRHHTRAGQAAEGAPMPTGAAAGQAGTRGAALPLAEVDPRYSDEGATPTRWDDARRRLAAAELFWISTVRPDGRPHVTPLLAVWLDEALHFCTGPQERKARNIALNPACVLTTGRNTFTEPGEDFVVEGKAVRITREAVLQRLARAWETKYGAEWHFDVREGTFRHSGDIEAHVFRVAPVKAFGFRRGEAAQTRWRFPS